MKGFNAINACVTKASDCAPGAHFSPIFKKEEKSAKLLLSENVRMLLKNVLMFFFLNK